MAMKFFRDAMRGSALTGSLPWRESVGVDARGRVRHSERPETQHKSLTPFPVRTVDQPSNESPLLAA